MCCFLPVNASVVVVPIEELDLLKGLLAWIVTGQVRVHAKKQVESCRPWEAGKSRVEKMKENSKRLKGVHILSHPENKSQSTAIPFDFQRHIKT